MNASLYVFIVFLENRNKNLVAQYKNGGTDTMLSACNCLIVSSLSAAPDFDLDASSSQNQVNIY